MSNARLWAIDRATFQNTMARTAAAHNARMRTMLRAGVLAELDEAQLSRAADAAAFVSFTAGEQIISKGEPGETFYIIERGSVVCTRLPGEQADNTLEAGDYFGERALLKREPRAADVFAAEDVSLIALHREDFENLLGDLRPLLESNMGTRLLLCVPLLARLGDAERAALFAKLRLVTYRDGATVLPEGAPVGAFFIIAEGAVRVTRADGGAVAGLRIAPRLQLSAGEADLSPTAAEGRLIAGQWFGDLEVADGAPAPATFAAAPGPAPTQCFVLDAATYTTLLAPLARELQKAQRSSVTTTGAGTRSSASAAR